MHFFSVIIPTLNEEKYLPRLLSDLAKQASRNFEVIVVDASSEDKTREEAKKFAEHFPLTISMTDRKNVSYSRNFGAQHAKGEYLVFLDADCRISPGFTKNLHRVILKRKGLMFIPYLLPEENSSQAKILFEFVNFFIGLSNNTGRPFSSSGSMICEADFYKKIGGFNEHLFIAEDHDIIYKSLQWGVRAKFLPSIKIKFSLRRMKKDGQLNMMYKYFLVSAHLIFRGNVKKKMFEYEMGGQRYKALPVPKEVKNYSFEDFIHKSKTLFMKILHEERI